MNYEKFHLFLNKGSEFPNDPTQSLEPMQYFLWTLEDIRSKSMVRSSNFTVKGVKFCMVYYRDSDMCSICIELGAKHRKLGIEFCLDCSISVIFSCETLEDTYFTCKEIIGKGKGCNVAVWLVEQQKFYKLVKDLGSKNGKDTVTFLCVFGPLAECQKDVLYSEGTRCESHCIQRLVNDLQKLRLNTDCSIVLKCGKDEIKAHEIILSARSGKFADMFRNGKAAEKAVQIADMTFEVLDNLINYIYSGRLKEDEPSEDLLMQLYETAVKYRVDSLKLMASCRLIEMLDYKISPRTPSDAITFLPKLEGLAKKHCDVALKEKINFCLKKPEFNFGRNCFFS